MNRFCFISGPVTGVENYLENFHAAESEVKALGFEPINPLLLSEPYLAKGIDLGYDGWLHLDLSLLDLCDSIYLLRGHERSDGSLVEQHHAKLQGKQFFYQSDAP